MNISPFSKHIFWSWKPDADLPENVVIQQVIAYGEISDFRLMTKLIPKRKIVEAIEKWKNKDQYKKHIHFLTKVYLYA